jgi:hypothetical protein
MTKPPAFLFYPGDFLMGRVATYTLEERGAYITLLAYNWNMTSLPSSPEVLAKLLGLDKRIFARLWRKIGDQFEDIGGGQLSNPRLQAERQKQLAYSQSRSENAKQGGRPAKHKESIRKAHAKHSESFSVSSSITTTTSAGAASSWTARVAAKWSELVGPVTPGRVGAQLKAVYERHGEERLLRAMRVFVPMRESEGRDCSFASFVREAERWVERTPHEPAVIDGEMNAEMEMLTRPPKLRAS